MCYLMQRTSSVFLSKEVQVTIKQASEADNALGPFLPFLVSNTENY